VDKVTSRLSQRKYARKTFKGGLGFDLSEIAKDFLNELKILKCVNHYHCIQLVSTDFISLSTKCDQYVLR
jgi:hypothetical protein